MSISKKATDTKTVYVCGECKQQKQTAEEADRCCICSRCGKRLVTRPERGWHRNEECDRCRFIGFIRSARADVRRHKENLESAEKHLAEILGEMAFVEQGMTQEQAQRAYKAGRRTESA